MAQTLRWNNDNPLQISQHQSSVNEKSTAKRSLALAPDDAGSLLKRSLPVPDKHSEKAARQAMPN
jgi:hypothetical protein